MPSDIITTGTTAGIGAARGRFLRDGDKVEEPRRGGRPPLQGGDIDVLLSTQ